MNLEESDAYIVNQKKNDNRRKMIIISIVFLAILAALLLIMIIIIKYQDSLKLKLYIDGKQQNISSTLLYEQNNETYVNIKEFAELLGYKYNKGEYQKYNENSDSCYVTNNIETVALTAEATSYAKYITISDALLANRDGILIGGIATTAKAENGKKESYKIVKPITTINDMLYMPFEYLVNVFNVQVNTSEENRIRIYSLDALVKNSVSSVANLGYAQISGTYENLKSTIYGMAVVSDGSNYGVVSLKTGEEIISLKYNEIVFVQNVKEFLVAAETTVGLLSSDGSTIIKPTEYDEISVLDDLNGLYLVEKDREYGVLNRNGNVVIYVEYDSIGYKGTKNFANQEIDNYNIWFDSVIPIEDDSKFGLYDIDGTELLKTVYNGFGYEVKSTDIANEESVLLIPESVGIKGLVVNLNEGYGIFDIETKSIIIPCVCTRIYSITKSGVTKYYMEYAEEQIELKPYLESQNLISIGKEKSVETNSEIDEESENTTTEVNNTNTTTEDVNTNTNTDDTSEETE